jgi:hypothetical protein
MARLIGGSLHDAISIFSNILLFEVVVDYLGDDYREKLLSIDLWDLFAAPGDFDCALDWDWLSSPVFSLPIDSFPK